MIATYPEFSLLSPSLIETTKQTMQRAVYSVQDTLGTDMYYRGDKPVVM
jgi:hypothetical protein